MKMKTLIPILSLLFGVSMSAVADSQTEQLKKKYEAEGDRFLISLFWLPETREAVFKHIPNDPSFYGCRNWNSVAEEKKLAVLDEVGAQFGLMDAEEQKLTWQRITDWRDIMAQLCLLDAFCDKGIESFLNLAALDPILYPEFKDQLDARGPDFEPGCIGDSLPSAILCVMHPRLTLRLLNTPEEERLMCFSRFFARIADTKNNQAEQGGADQRPTPTEPKSEGDSNNKPQ